MSPAVKYTLARLGLLAAVFVLLVPVPMNLMLKLMIAVLVSAILGWFLLSKMRDEVATQVEQGLERRKAQKEKLRSALAGDDEEERSGVQ
ncbi:DUF4229 domain-containing protein [Rhizocola hellebori]|uniref:DUF4229 domain-containing protein n=1 Tax=Rhizocola hellebori TaxID=1392758 RepID=UPI0019426D6A|nr:DUF4229 domain-containing protein [Rhizocola hellebori]